MPQPFPALSPAAGHPSRPGKTLTSLGQGQEDSPQPCSLPSHLLGSEQGLCGGECIHVLPCQLPARKLFPQPVPEETWLCPKGTRFQRGKPRLGCAAWQGLLHSNVIWGSYPMGGVRQLQAPPALQATPGTLLGAFNQLAEACRNSQCRWERLPPPPCHRRSRHCSEDRLNPQQHTRTAKQQQAPSTRS